MTLKVGDRVEYIAGNEWHYPGWVGQTGVVTQVDGNIVDWMNDAGESRWGSLPANLRKIEDDVDMNEYVKKSELLNFLDGLNIPWGSRRALEDTFDLCPKVKRYRVSFEVDRMVHMDEIANESWIPAHQDNYKIEEI